MSNIGVQALLREGGFKAWPSLIEHLNSDSFKVNMYICIGQINLFTHSIFCHKGVISPGKFSRAKKDLAIDSIQIT